MQPRSLKSQEILLPIRTRFIVLTFIVALALNLLPWGEISTLVRPDFIVLVLLYWTINQPRKVGMGAGWVLGLVMDVADGSLFGQHALAYTAVAFAALFLHRRIQMFPLWQQSLHVFPLLLFTLVIMLIVRLLAGAPFPGWAYFASSITGALVWVPVSLLLQMPQRRKPKTEPA
jgi:rod shape-determining protein MreD